MAINQLTDKRIRSIREPGNYADGGNLYLRVRNTGAKSFIFKATVNKRQLELTIGPYGGAQGQYTLALARQKRDQIMEKIRCGETPRVADFISTVDDTVEAEPVPSFGVFALDLVKQIEGGFRNEKHRAQWRSTLTTYCVPIWEKPLDQITTDDILSIVRPIWLTTSETASRLLGRIERVLNAAKARGFRSGENPAAWKGHLDQILPRRKKLQRGHHPALPFDDLPEFWKKLTAVNSISAMALQFLILTAARSGEIRGARWDEIDENAMRWTIPGSRMKANREHVVPLTDGCIEILRKMREIRHSDFIFPGTKQGGMLSDMTLSKVLHGICKGYTVHGFRSTFRDWCGEKTDFSREHAEACLAHTVGNAVELAYRRGTSIEARRRILNAWSNFIQTGKSPLFDVKEV